MRACESYRQRFTEESLRGLYLSRVGVRPTVGLDKVTGQKFEADLEENIGIILRKVGNETYHFTSFRQMLMLKGKESPPREICIPTVRDKLTLAVLSKVIDDVYVDVAVPPMPQPIIDDIASAIGSGDYDTFAKFDIEKFFASIDHSRLMRVVRRKVRKKEVLHLIREAIETPSAFHGVKADGKRRKGVPEGLSVSGKLANIYASDIDCVMRSIPGIEYHRYVDDILVLCKSDDLDSVEGAIVKQIEVLGLTLHSEKTMSGSLTEKEFDYLGYLFLPDGKVSVRKASVRNLERALDEIIGSRDRYETEQQWLWRLNLRITGCRITLDGQSFERYGWIYYFSRITDTKLIWRLDRLVDKLLTRRGIDRPSGLKTFKKAYYEGRHRSATTKYIPTYGANMSVDEMREMMLIVFNERNVASLEDDDVRRLFNDRIRREARRLERDVGLVS